MTAYCQTHGIDSTKLYNGRPTNTNLTWRSNKSDVTEEEVFDEATYNFNELVAYFRIRTVKENENNEYGRVLNITEKLPDTIHEQRHRVFGKCYTFIATKGIKNLGVYYIKIKL